MCYYVYILANTTNVAIYIGVTNNIIRRVYEHRSNTNPMSFTARYSIHKLVYYEETGDIRIALEREKQLKSWNRSRKNTLIEQFNPSWEDLYPRLF